MSDINGDAEISLQPTLINILDNNGQLNIFQEKNLHVDGAICELSLLNNLHTNSCAEVAVHEIISISELDKKEETKEDKRKSIDSKEKDREMVEDREEGKDEGNKVEEIEKKENPALNEENAEKENSNKQENEEGEIEKEEKQDKINDVDFYVQNQISELLYIDQEEPEVNDVIILEPFPVPNNTPVTEDCSICMENREMYSLNCHHKFCRECLEEYFRTRINSGLVVVVPCPNRNCGEPCVEHDIKVIVGPAEFDRYQKFHYLSSLRTEPTIRWCPTIDCGNPVFGDPNAPGFPALTCNKCNMQFCYDCNRTWHPDLTCKDNFKKLKKSGALSHKDEKWKKKHKSRKCAQCRIDIVKDKGCNHMICGGCGYQFCWVCMKPFTPDHYIFGSCAGLQFSNYPIAKKRLKKAGKIALIGGAIVILVPTTVVIVAGVVVPVLIITVPIYGGYRLVKHVRRKRREKRNRRKNNNNNNNLDLDPI